MYITVSCLYKCLDFYYKNVIVGSRDLFHGLLNIIIKANGYLPLVYWLKSLFTEFFFGAQMMICKMSWIERIIL